MDVSQRIIPNWEEISWSIVYSVFIRCEFTSEGIALVSCTFVLIGISSEEFVILSSSETHRCRKQQFTNHKVGIGTFISQFLKFITVIYIFRMVKKCSCFWVINILSYNLPNPKIMRKELCSPASTPVFSAPVSLSDQKVKKMHASTPYVPL